MNNAYFTLLSSDNYLEGFFFFNEFFQRSNPQYPLNVMITDNCSQKTFFKLEQYCKGYKNIIIRKIRAVNFKHADVKRWVTTLNKFQILNYKEYDKVAFVDIDILFFKNMDFVFNKCDKIWCWVEEDIPRGLTTDGKWCSQFDMVDNPERKAELKKYYSWYGEFRYNFWGGLFVMNTKQYNFEDIVKQYREYSFSADEFVLNDIIIKDKPLYEKLFNISKEEALIKDISQEDETGNAVYFIHFKIWFFPFNTPLMHGTNWNGKDFNFLNTTEKRKDFVNNMLTNTNFRREILDILQNYYCLLI